MMIKLEKLSLIFSFILLILFSASCTKPNPLKGFEGTWDTNWGKMILKVEGNKVVGTYTHDNGKIEATLSADGKTMDGTWSEYPSYKPSNDAGRVTFTLSEDGKSLSGQWWYGQDGTGGSWTGTKVLQD